MRGIVLFLLFVFLPAIPTPASSLEDIRARGSLRVGMSGDYQPFSACEGTGDQEQCQGLDVDIARRLAADLGVRLAIVRFRWPELMDDLGAHKFDLAMSGITVRPERALVATFTRPYLLAGAVVLVADARRFSSLGAVNRPEVRLIVNAGGHLERVARLRFPAVNLLTTRQNMTLPDFIVKGQADALLTDSLEAPHFLDAHPQLRALPPIGRDRKAYLLRREDQELQEWLDAWLIKRETDGFLTQIRTRWLGKESGQTPFPPLAALFALMDVRLAVMPAVAAYKRDHQLPIEDLQQEARVLEKIAALATQEALDPAAVQDLFRVQIDMAKQVQRGVLHSQHAIPAWAHGRDLRQELRPTLNQLSTRIVQELARVAPMMRNRDEIFTTAQQEMTPETVTPEATLRLAQAIWKVKKCAGAKYE